MVQSTTRQRSAIDVGYHTNGRWCASALARVHLLISFALAMFRVVGINVLIDRGLA